MVALTLRDVMLTTFENISIRVLKWLFILAGPKTKSINELEARESKNSFT